MRFLSLLALAIPTLLFGQGNALPDSLVDPQERHLSHIVQLTFGGENAEAYFSFDESRLSFQTTRGGAPCDQIYTMSVDASDVRRLSSGRGRCTCAYYLPDGEKILYATTEGDADTCPPVPDSSHGYVWPLYKSYDIVLADTSGKVLRKLTSTPGYDAEATISPKGDRIVFTSVRDGDLDLYTMNLDGGDVRRITNTPGYDGGAFFSWDGKKIVWRASRPAPGQELDEYRALLAQGLIRPKILEIYVANADGSDARQVTHNGAANFCPFMHPDGEHIIFASNMGDPKGRNFDLYVIRTDGTGLERITFNPTFDGFPMWTHDGKKLVFASNRNDAHPG